MLDGSKIYKVIKIDLLTLEHLENVKVKLDENVLTIESDECSDTLDLTKYKKRVENKEVILENSYSLYSFK